jgi:hypothetical protein
MRLRARGEPPAPFARSPAEWRRLGGPVELWDEQAAARAWNAIAPASSRLNGPDFNQEAARPILARRYWRLARPTFLAEVGALSPRERELLERSPRRYALPDWWWQ